MRTGYGVGIYPDLSLWLGRNLGSRAVADFGLIVGD